MPDDQLNLDPARAMAGARGMVSAGRQLTSLRDSDGSAIASASATPPWGNDEIGSAFERTYRTLEQQTLGSWEGLAAYVQGLGYAAGQAVSNNMHADADAGTRVRGAWKSA